MNTNRRNRLLKIAAVAVLVVAAFLQPTPEGFSLWSYCRLPYILLVLWTALEARGNISGMQRNIKEYEGMAAS